MADLNNQQNFGSSDTQGSGLNLNATDKSPLEQTFAARASQSVNVPASSENVSSGSGTNSPSDTAPSTSPAPIAPSENPNETVASPEEPVKAPDTDEFLRRILEENPAQSDSAESTAAPAPEQQASVVPEAPESSSPMAEPTTAEPTVPAPIAPETTPTESFSPESTPAEPTPVSDLDTSIPDSSGTAPTEPPLNVDLNQTPTPGNPEPEQPSVGSDMAGAEAKVGGGGKITDATNMDGIFSQDTAQNIPGQGEQVASDVIGAMQKTPAPTGNNTAKLIGLAFLAIVLVGGGYFGYNMLFGTKNSTSTVSETASEETITATAVALTDDETRKADLKSLQNILADYWTSEGKYPTSNGLEFLNTSGNSLEKALVPTYLSSLPQDPDSTKKYGYKSDGTTYSLTAVLDSLSDPDAQISGESALLTVGPDTTLSSASAGTTLTPTASSTSASSTISYPPVPGEENVAL